jgi:aryl-alcohol dehydrogenase-like predicted oxidoreductase
LDIEKTVINDDGAIPNKLVIGTAQFGAEYGVANENGKVCLFEVERILSRAYGHGAKFLDTAIGYGDCEATLGKIGVGKFHVITKLPPIPRNITDLNVWMVEQVEMSLERLKINRAYGLLLHRSEDLTGETGNVVAEALRGLKSSGLAEKIGVSIYDPSELDSITQILIPDLVQAPLNLIDRRLESSDWLARLKKMGTEVHTRSSFLQGLLLMPRSSIPSQFKRWAGLWDLWAESLQTQNVSPLSACLSYTLAQSQVDRVVVGVDSLAQLEELIDAAMQPPVAYDFDFMSSDDEQLINPSRWSEL